VSTMITSVALDSHKKEHSVAVIYPDTGELVQWTVRNTQKDVAKMVKKIKQQAPGEVRFCYEAGVCGFVLKRWIEAHGCSCSVIAPSLIPVGVPSGPAIGPVCRLPVAGRLQTGAGTGRSRRIGGMHASCSICSWRDN